MFNVCFLMSDSVDSLEYGKYQMKEKSDFIYS